MTDILEVLKTKSGVMLDIGCGGAKQKNFFGIDARPLDDVDLVWDVLKFPWPLPDECALLAMASHLLEHIPPFQTDPKLLGLIQMLVDSKIMMESDVDKYIGRYDSTPMFIAFMNEVWRVLKPGRQFIVSVPYGRSDGQLQDPTHCNAMNEARWVYFDPTVPDSPLYNIYRPLPWKIENVSYTPEANMEVVMRKMTLAEVANG